MKQKLTLLILALFGTMGAWAIDVNVIWSAKDATTYGSLTGSTFTTNSASGLANVEISGITTTTATSFAYGACLGITSSASGTITMTAPDGYYIYGYQLTARSNTYEVPYTLTPSVGGSPVTTSTSGVTLTTTGLSNQTASFTYSASKANSFYIPAMTITLIAEGAETVNVVYTLSCLGQNLKTATITQAVGETAVKPLSCDNCFCTFSCSPTTIESSSTTAVTITATWNGPFEFSTDYASAKWYYMTMRTSKYAVYGETPPYTLTTTQDLTANGMWAFMGDPYGIKVINKAAGDGKYLQATASQPSMTTTATSWTIGNNGGNFTLYHSSVGYIHDTGGGGKMVYWNNSGAATDDGSVFRVEEAEPTIVINNTTGTYYTEGGAAIDPTAESGFWGPTWKSTRTIGANNLLTLTTSTGMNSKNADIYTGNDGAVVRYTLTAATGYVITGYSVTGTANSTDITISPRIRKNLTITSGNSGTLSVTDLDLKTTSFTLSGAESTQGYLSDVTLSVTLKPTATVSYTPPVANNTTATIGYKHIASNARYMTYMKADAGGVISANQVSTTFDPAPLTAAGFTFEYNSELRAYYIKETSTNKYVYAKDDLTWAEGNRNTTTNVAALGVDNLPVTDEGKTIFQWTIDDGGTSVGQASYYIRPKSNINTAISIQSMSAGILGFYDNATKNYDFAHASLITWEQQVGLYYTSARSSNVMKAGKVGYPRTESTAYTNLYGLISTFISGHTYTQSDYTNLLSYYDAYIAAEDIQMPVDGKVYSFINVQADGTTMYYLNDNEGTLTPTAYTEGETVLPESAEFVCHVTDGGKHVFVSKNGRYMQGASKGTYAAALATSYDSEKQDVTFTKFPVENSGNVEQTSATFAFGRVWMETQKGATRLYTTDFIIKGSDGTYDNCSGAYLKNGLSTVYQIVGGDDYYNKVTLTSDGTDAYASLYLPFPVTIPEGITAYAVTSHSGGYAHLDEIVSNGTLPANNATILRKEGQTSTTSIYLSPAEDAGTSYGGNLLSGTVETGVANPGTGIYVLGKINNAIGLYEYTAANLAPGKAYLNADGLGVKALFFDFEDDPDAINLTPALSEGEVEIYNVAGQRLQKMQKGINIVNGKKVMVK